MKIENILTLIGINHHFISHYSKTHWGFSILIMGKKGECFARLYQYDDEKDVVYLDWLSVDENSRKQGVGTELQKIREEIGRKLGATTSCLWVKKDTWMYNWYKRRGYEDWKDNKNEDNAIWMKKTLVQSSI